MARAPKCQGFGGVSKGRPVCCQRSVSAGMVEEAVCCEPVSASNSLLTGKKTGNFADFGPLLRFLCPIRARIQNLTAIFPARRSREYFCWNREFSQGSRDRILHPRTHVVSHFSHTCSAADEHDLFSPSICGWRERDGERSPTVDATGRGVLARLS